MKRTIIIFSIILSIIIAIPSLGHAQTVPTEVHPVDRMSEHSSLYIEPAVLEAVDLDSADNILKVYNTSIYSFFFNYNTVDEIANSKYSGIFYVILYGTGEINFYEEKFGLMPPDGIMFDFDLPSIYFNGDPIRKVSPDINVYNMYYLSGATNHQGSALWYETDMGNYVYYNIRGGLLMPSGVFVDYIRAVYEERASRLDGRDGATGGEPDFDLAPYTINSVTFDPSAWSNDLNTDLNNQKPDNQLKTVVIISASAVVIAAVTVILWKRKKHNA